MSTPDPGDRENADPRPDAPAAGAAAAETAVAEATAGARRRLWAAGTEPAEERTTARLRRIVQGLPDWSPLPPGEQLVRRPGSRREQP
ncbi:MULTISPECIES: hypothetical protein [Streptomyces]|uniref:hypothetical protein n=1 Tax=Streptomyces TaxID=1883 RepID=UPI000F7A7FD1|nr:MULTISPECIES: hypothetical protein [Streptomyces]RSS99375.1 hypothetical protein EF910_35690 [Streptomyces sp. WAC07149]GLX17194.1 hypothetical protein Slala01_08380 [Streptomyces lavendulae subsp. lavendulae]GLX24947.1 hypothetical protein Slala02_07670 [Streptomyces lavendulae subsp. lavendulae]